jgi:hypothetical protein
MNLETFVDAYGVIRDAQSKNTTPWSNEKSRKDKQRSSIHLTEN